MICDLHESTAEPFLMHTLELTPTLEAKPPSQSQLTHLQTNLDNKTTTEIRPYLVSFMGGLNCKVPLCSILTVLWFLKKYNVHHTNFYEVLIRRILYIEGTYPLSKLGFTFTLILYVSTRFASQKRHTISAIFLYNL